MIVSILLFVAVVSKFSEIIEPSQLSATDVRATVGGQNHYRNDCIPLTVKTIIVNS